MIRPAWVYGDAGGAAQMIREMARQTGVARFVGDGRNRWTTVHAADLAELYLLAFQKSLAGAIFNGADGPAIPLIEIARAAGRSVGAEPESWPLEQARQTLGGFADAIACDQVVSGALARVELGWSPSRPSLLQELGAA